jgi:hypothetical protein
MTTVAAGRSVHPIARVLARLGAGVSAFHSGRAHATGMAILDASSDFQRAAGPTLPRASSTGSRRGEAGAATHAPWTASRHSPGMRLGCASSR